jgi:osmotically-inducible protein OsmY
MSLPARNFSSDKKEERFMAPSTAPQIQPTGEEMDAVEANAPLLTQSREDLHLAERVGHALHATGYGALRGITVNVQARIVLLRGRVPSYYLKQIAQTIALAVPGIHRIRNDLEVVQLS